MMPPIPFVAASAEEAVAQIRERLGPEAVVLNVRPLPANGLARLWQKPMIEVLAHVPGPSTPEASPIVETLAEFRQQLQEIKQQVEKRDPETGAFADPPAMPYPDPLASDAVLNGGHWRVGGILQQTGLLPLHVQFILDQLRSQHGETPPSSLREEISLTRRLLAGFWRQPRLMAGRSTHVLIGPAGSGKTTHLCKWLTQAALIDGRQARVWRLDGATANLAEGLSVHCDILGVPAERSWQMEAAEMTAEIGFIDLPGVDWRNPAAVKELGGQIKQFGMPEVHLVLNGAYDSSLLLAQIRAFAALPIQDISITHLDEELRWGKLWNLVLGTNYSLRHFGTGQNIPGDFCEATPERVFNRQFPHK
jgi:flagellar biosynthesis protein FlhF